MILRAVARFFPYSFSLLSFSPVCLPLAPFSLYFFGLSLVLPSPVREIKQLKSAFTIRRKKATACICVHEIILSWRIAIHVGFRCFPLFFLRGHEHTDKCALFKIFPFEFYRCDHNVRRHHFFILFHTFNR